MDEGRVTQLADLFESNREWVQRIRAEDPDFFRRLSHQQSPTLLWIGCSDSRVPANQIVGRAPGELFVHRNVANLVVHTDLNCLSVVQFAVDVLRVQHIIVCGHYGCGGVNAVVTQQRLGLVDNWLRHLTDVYVKHQVSLDAITDETRRVARLCELNVAEQVENLGTTTVVRDAWARGQPLVLHGWIYDVADGLLHDLEVSRHGTSP